MNFVAICSVFSFFIFCSANAVESQGNIAEQTRYISKLRKELSHRYGHIAWRDAKKVKNPVQLFSSLGKDGSFTNIKLNHEDVKKKNWRRQINAGNALYKAFKRLYEASCCVRNGKVRNAQDIKKLSLAIQNYSKIEQSRPDLARFHFSCFAIPKYSGQMYFILLPVKDKYPELEGALDELKQVAFQAFTQPRRKDINNPYSIEQFRNHGHWTGGNFSYRPLFLAAAVNGSPRLFEVIWNTCLNGLSVTSYNSSSESFWQEGLTADGSGWGHGSQNYPFGYPLDGVKGIIRTMVKFKGSPWFKEIPKEKFDIISNFLQGIVWLQYKTQPGLTVNGRHNLQVGQSGSCMIIPHLIDELKALNPPEGVMKELVSIQKQFRQKHALDLKGVRYFWNSDDLVMRGKDYYALVNMMSTRSTGPESALHGKMNYNMGDGSTVLLKKGNEYNYSKGGWNFSVPPGVTARKCLFPDVDVWRGFNSKHNFAGGVGGKNGCSAFIMEKADNIRLKRFAKLKKYKKWNNFEIFYGVKAYKSYFMVDGIMVALGAGIENLTPKVKGDIVTMINQTAGEGTTIFNGKVVNGDFHKKINMRKEQKNPWVIHDGIGYAVLPGFTTSTVSVSKEKRSTKWNAMDKRNAGKNNAPGEVSVFQIDINHNCNPEHDSYAYLVYLKDDVKSYLPEFARNPDIRIISNTTKLQAVYFEKRDISQIIFYTPDVVYNDGKRQISVDRKAVVMVEKLENGKSKISISDPTQDPELKSITMQFNGEKMVIPLPGKPFCGKQTSIIL